MSSHPLAPHEHGSRWIADLPLRRSSPLCTVLRAAQGTRTTIQIGNMSHRDVVIVLADVSADVETWRVFNAENDV